MRARFCRTFRCPFSGASGKVNKSSLGYAPVAAAATHVVVTTVGHAESRRRSLQCRVLRFADHGPIICLEGVLRCQGGRRVNVAIQEVTIMIMCNPPA